MILLTGRSKIAYSVERIAYSKKDLSAKRYPLNAKKGFLLLEVIISIAILSLSLTVILNSFMSSMRSIEYSEDMFRASLLLEDKLFELSNTNAMSGPLEGNFPDFAGIFSWQADIVEAEPMLLDEVGISVLWGKGNKEKSFAVSTYNFHTENL